MVTINEPSSARRRVLVIDDDRTVAAMVEEMLLEFGFESAGVAGDLDTALRLAEAASFDVALLDLNLGGRASWPVAEALTARGVPFLFVTGYDRVPRADGFLEARCLGKPFRAAELREALLQALSRSG